MSGPNSNMEGLGMRLSESQRVVLAQAASACNLVGSSSCAFSLALYVHASAEAFPDEMVLDHVQTADWTLRSHPRRKWKKRETLPELADRLRAEFPQANFDLGDSVKAA